MRSTITMIITLTLCGSLNASGNRQGTESGKKLTGYLATKPEYKRTLEAMFLFRAEKVPAVGVATHRAANEFAPENTLSAMQCALDLQVDYIEIDVRQTKDGQSLLLHDGNLDRTTSGKGPLRELSFAEARKLSAGAWFDPFFEAEKIPTLEEACRLVSDHNKTSGHPTYFYVDCKDINAKVLIECLVKYGLLEGSVFYVNNPETQIRQLREIAPAVKVMPGLGNASDLDRMIETWQPYALDVSWKSLTKELIDRAHAKGIRIFSDGFGENQNVEAYVNAIQTGIDVISTNKISVIYDAAARTKQ
jgi:glycerophosphoryl diester phosphodiesterase